MLNKMLKRTLAGSLAALMLAGCTGGTAPSPTAAPAPATPAAATPAPAAPASQAAATPSAAPASQAAPTVAPVSGTPTKFRYYRDSYNGVAIQGWQNMLWMQEWQKRMNVEIEFLGPASGDDFAQAINIMLASGDYPEVIYNDWNRYSGGLTAAIEDGIALDLGANYRDKLPNWFALLDSNDEVRRAVTLDDGTSALLCHVEEELKRAAYAGYAIRKDWLDQLNMEVPTTIDELVAFFDAVLATDLNGNGENDEIPITESRELSLLSRLAPAWGLRMKTIGRDPSTGKITWWTQVDGGNAFMDFTRTMADWYQKGYFETDAPSMESAAKMANITGDLAGFFQMNSGNAQQWYDIMKAEIPEAYLYGMVPLVGPAGKPYTDNNAHVRYAASNEGTIITETAIENGNIDAILKFLDYGYSDEGFELMSWGVEGVAFTKDAQGNYQWTEAVTNDPEFGFKDNITKFAIPNRGGWPKIMSYEAWCTIDAIPEMSLTAHENFWKADTGILVPPIMLSKDEADKYNNIMTDANTMINENFAKFFIGTRPIEELPAFMEELKVMKIDEAMSYYQAAYDRYMSK